MVILHYALGFPPYRRGGLTKYCIDLMCVQCENEHNVAMIWPGTIGIFYKLKPRIKKHRAVEINGQRLESYEMTGMLPVPLLEGVSNPLEFMKNINANMFIEFIDNFNPDVIHFHTLMGFPINYMEILKEKGIMTIFTSHDYFGLCPRTTLYYNGKMCINDHNCRDCCICNESAMSIRKISILQSSYYRLFKNSRIIGNMRTRYRSNSEVEKEVMLTNSDSYLFKNDFIVLRKYYINLLSMMSLIHFNSTNTKTIYLKYAKNLNGRVVNITHGNIKDCRTLHKVKDEVIFSYLGPQTSHKGYYLLKDICDQLYKKGYKFKLNVYFNDIDKREYLICNEPYSYDELDKVMNKTNCSIVPSLWNETYGFTVLESMLYGVPVIVSEFVGAKDVINNNIDGFILENCEHDLEKCLLDIIVNPSRLDEMSENICKNFKPKTIQNHYIEVMNLYLGKDE